MKNIYDFMVGDKVICATTICNGKASVGTIVAIREDCVFVQYEDFNHSVLVNNLDLLTFASVIDEFKEGQKVKVRYGFDKDKVGTVVKVSSISIYVRFTNGTSTMYFDKAQGNVPPHMSLFALEITEQPKSPMKQEHLTVRIARIGRDVVASLVDNDTNKRLGQGIAHCNPSDEFNYMTGVQIAINRLVDKLEEKHVLPDEYQEDSIYF